jgi:dethiobiotin synthetase
MGAIFVTSTGTNIGKTFVAAGLIRVCRDRGVVVHALKPVVSGFESATAETSDPGLLLKALGRPRSAAEIERVAPWRFRAPLAPDLAAAREGRTLDFGALIAFCRNAMRTCEGTLYIEGVGGVMAPLDADHTVLDWMALLGVPLLLVTGSYLGSISHTLTALHVLAQHKLDVATIIVSESAQSPVALEDTIQSLRRFSGAIPLVGLPRLPGGIAQHPAFTEIAGLAAAAI